MSATATIQASSTVTFTMDSGETLAVNDASVLIPMRHQVSFVFSSGTGAGAINHPWKNTFTVDTTGTTLDLKALTGGNDGASRNFTKVKAILIENKSSTIAINLGNAASNAWVGINTSTTALTPVDPLGAWARIMPSAAGIAVATDNKSLLIASASSTASVTVTIWGEGT